MKMELVHDKNTDVAFVDFCDAEPSSSVHVVDVSEELGLRSQVLARVSEEGEVLGVVIEDYSSFRREVRRKYAALAVDLIIDLIIRSVRSLVQNREHNGAVLATC